MTSHVRDELAEALRNNNGQLGVMSVVLKLDKTTNGELVDGHAAANQNVAAKPRMTIKAIFDGIMSNVPTVAARFLTGFPLDAQGSRPRKGKWQEVESTVDLALQAVDLLEQVVVEELIYPHRLSAFSETERKSLKN